MSALDDTLKELDEIAMSGSLVRNGRDVLRRFALGVFRESTEMLGNDFPPGAEEFIPGCDE